MYEQELINRISYLERDDGKMLWRSAFALKIVKEVKKAYNNYILFRKYRTADCRYE